MEYPTDPKAEAADVIQAPQAPPTAQAAPEPAPRADSPERSEATAMEPIRAIDPGFASFAALAAMPEAEAFNRLVLKGNSLADAFRLARYDALAARRAAESAKDALSRAYNRAHLSATSPAGTRMDMVPPDTMEMYRQICPGLPDEAYRAHYRRAKREKE